jgi:general stress protein 26
MEAANIKEEIWKHIKEEQIVFLATVKEKQPKVRPVTLLYIDNKFWVTTNINSSKSKQILENPKTEFCLLLENKENPYNSGYIRAEGIAKITRERDTKHKVGQRAGVFGTFFKDVDDPDYALMEITLKRIEYIRPNEKERHMFVL